MCVLCIYIHILGCTTNSAYRWALLTRVQKNKYRPTPPSFPPTPPTRWNKTTTKAHKKDEEEIPQCCDEDVSWQHNTRKNFKRKPSYISYRLYYYLHFGSIYNVISGLLKSRKQKKTTTTTKYEKETRWLETRTKKKLSAYLIVEYIVISNVIMYNT